MPDPVAITIELVGGPLDGDAIFVQPRCSVALPQQLRFLSANADEAVWETYESTTGPVIWGEVQGAERKVPFSYIGQESVL